MSENFRNKDYADYFEQLEKRLTAPEKERADIGAAAVPVKTVKKGAGRVNLHIRAAILIAAMVLCAVLILAIRSCTDKTNGTDGISPIETTQVTDKSVKSDSHIVFTTPANLTAPDIALESRCVFMVCLSDNTVVAAKNADERAYPASVTKIMTVLTAAERITDMSQTFKFTYALTDPFYEQEATMAGFSNNESVPVIDLFYGAVLPSGADATQALAEIACGTADGFVKLMNNKTAELGLKGTNFTNPAGLFNENNYTTAADMAVITAAAMKNELCKNVLTAATYTTSKTTQHPEGIPLSSTLFNSMYGTEPETAVITGGKTGFVNESGYCIAAFGTGSGGAEYVCVTLGAPDKWKAVYDQIHLFARYAK